MGEYFREYVWSFVFRKTKLHYMEKPRLDASAAIRANHDLRKNLRPFILLPVILAAQAMAS